jgi:hypothetical protein
VAAAQAPVGWRRIPDVRDGGGDDGLHARRSLTVRVRGHRTILDRSIESLMDIMAQLRAGSMSWFFWQDPALTGFWILDIALMPRWRHVKATGQRPWESSAVCCAEPLAWQEQFMYEDVAHLSAGEHGPFGAP